MLCRIFQESPKLVNMKATRNPNSLTLTHTQVEALKERGQRLAFQQPTTLIYQGHIPIVAFLILKGPVFLKKKRGTTQKICPYTLVGLEELVHHHSFKRDLNVHAGSEVLSLDRSTLQEILGEEAHEFHPTLVGITESVA
jgi:hypothetical protein